MSIASHARPHSSPSTRSARSSSVCLPPESWFREPAPEPTVRLELHTDPGENPVAGAWWPWNRDLAAQAPALLTAVGAAFRSSVVHLVYDRASWSPVPHRLPIGGGYVKAGWFDLQDPHQVSLRMYDGHRVVLLVVPPEAGRRTALRAMHQAADPYNRLGPAQILPR
ncbi:DUF5994 family protein [Cellulomonas sp. P22]|uniref:DUF5994 family protein n=1 Tax=Cellulomonas sp. P22 TaxID=3373189 RepID=UPI003794D9B0